MVSFQETVAIGSLAAIPPLLIGILLGYLPRGRWKWTRLPVFTTIAAGIITWFFLDVMSEAAFLGVNQGFSGGPAHLLIVLLFPLGLFTMIALDQWPRPNAMADPAYLAALAVGFHGIAEGVLIGSGFAPATDILGAIGGIEAGESFVAHKILEGFAIGVLLNLQGDYSRTVKTALLAGLPTVLGLGIGYILSPDSSFFFALGAGPALWLLARLLQQSSSLTNKTVWAISLLAGVLLMYTAGLLHTG